jgi:phosphohistidine phosphatase
MTAKFVILLRHGIAEEKGTKPDEQRELTKVGHERMKKIARNLPTFFPHIEAIFSSPLIRAVQTAEWVARAYDLPIAQTDVLAPTATPATARTFIRDTDLEHIVCVGHEPSLTALMQSLTGITGALELKKGGCYGLRVHEDGATLECMLPARLLR